MRRKVIVNVVPGLVGFTVALLQGEVIVLVVLVVVDAVVIVLAILELTVLGVIPILLVFRMVAIFGLDVVVAMFFHRFPALVLVFVLVIDLNVLVVALEDVNSRFCPPRTVSAEAERKARARVTIEGMIFMLLFFDGLI